MTESPPRQTSPRSEPPGPVRWRSWPLRDEPVRGLAVVAVLLAAAAVVGWLSGSAYLGVLGLAALGVALWRFFLPVVFEVGEEGVCQGLFGRQRRIPWTSVRHFRVCSTGILLLPHDDRSAMAAFRGLYLPWTNHRDEVLENVRYYLEGAA